MKKLLILSGVTLMLVVLILMAGPNKVSAEPGVKTLKIGALVSFEFPLGRDCQKQLDAIVPVFNEKGGLVIGGEKYKIELILYDSKLSREIARAAVERLVHRDKVKFILGDETVEACLPVTEANKVVVVATCPSPAIFNPENKYVFQASSLNTQRPMVWGWFSDNYPDLKTLAGAFPDNIIGHRVAHDIEELCNAFGQKIIAKIFYPPKTTDFAAIATKIKMKNPHVFHTGGGGPVQDALLYKALYEAGYKGQICMVVAISAGSIARVISLDMVEGMISAIAPTDLDSPPPVAKELKDAYKAKYGTWDYPANLHINNLYCLMAGLEQAQSLDPDKVAAVISNGMKFESAFGSSMMISRPDFGNPRTVDTLVETYITRIEKGKSKLIYKIPIEQGLKYNKICYGW